MSIREYTPADYPQLVAIDRAIYPDVPAHVKNYEEWDEISEGRNPELVFKRWVYERDGQVVAYTEHSRGVWNFDPQKFFVTVRVQPDFQGQGIGAELYNLIMESLIPYNPQHFFSRVFEPHATALKFAENRGFEVTLREGELRLNVADFNPAEFVDIVQKVSDQGVIIKPSTEWAKELPDVDRAAYELDMQISPDVPSDEPFKAPSFETWHETVWQREMNRKDGLMMARHNDQFVGLSIIWANRGSTLINQDLTGVIREYRGRGIGLALKVHVINYCLAKGYTALRTQNEEDNRPMLIINQRLGFKAQPAWLHITKKFENV